MRPSFETAASRPPQDEVQLVETQQPHAEERATRASRSMDSKRLTYLPWSVLALYPGPGERGLRFTAVHIDVLARHLAAGIDGHDIEHPDPGRERRAARLLERKHHGPFEHPVIVAVEQAADLERKVELFESLDAALPQG